MRENPSSVLIVVQSDVLGGAEQLMLMLACNAAKLGTRVDVFILRKPIHHGWSNVPVGVRVNYLNAPNYLFGFLGMIPVLVCLTWKSKYDIILSSNINVNSILGLMRRFGLLRSGKLVIRETTSVFLRYRGGLRWMHSLKYLIGYDGADLVICQTKIMKSQFLSHFSASRNWPLVVLQNPVDLVSIRNDALHRSNDIPDKPYVLSMGRMIPEKGFDNLIKSFAQAFEKEDLCLVILGDGPDIKKLRDLANTLGILHRVSMPGFVSNPMPYVRDARMAVVSSRVEGFPNALLQMMAIQNRVVSTLCAGGVEDIPGIITCEPDNTDALSAAMRHCWDSVPQYLEEREKWLNQNTVDAYWGRLLVLLLPHSKKL